MTKLASPIRRAYSSGRTLLQTMRALGPASAALGWRYAAALPFPENSDREHLQATLAWLFRAQDATGGDGVSAMFSLDTGWDVPYPETSGYIIATFLAGYDYLKDIELAERARRIGDWEISVQAPNGGVRSRPGSDQTRVFNTGQVILGWCVLHERTNEAHYLDAARRAGDYLISLQESDGAWRRDTFCGARTYHARTDWGLLRLAKLSGEARYAEAATRNLHWVLRQQQDNGWFKNCGFHDADPITHVIDYTFIGVLECALLEPAAFDRNPAAVISHGVDAICDIIERPGIGGMTGMIPASFSANWSSRDDYSCLTGNAQLAYTLFRLYGLTGTPRYAACADALVAALKRTQTLNGLFAEVRGGLPGCFPMSRGYHANSFPNWGAKFFADALLMSLNRGARFSVAA